MIDDTIYAEALSSSIAQLRKSDVTNEITRTAVSPMSAGAVVDLTTRNIKRGGHIMKYEYTYDRKKKTCTLNKEPL